MKDKIARYMTVVVFSVLILGFTVANLLTKDIAFSESENRYLQQKPKFTFERLISGKYAEEVEKYKTDQFIMRDDFIGLKTQADYLSGKKDTNGVFFAKDGYLIEKHEVTNPDQLTKNIGFISQFADKATALLGKEHVSVMIVPTAGNILTDKLPAYATDFDQNPLLDEIATMNATVPDLRKALSAHKSEDIYYKTDHHWTTLGAYYAYRVWCDATGTAGHTLDDFTKEAVTDEFYGTIYSKARLYSTKPDTIHRYLPKEHASFTVTYNQGEKVMDTLYQDEFLKKRDKYSYFLGGNNPVVKIESENQNGKKVLLIKDSYAHSIAPFFANDFSEVHMLDLRYLNFSVEEYIKSEGITDVVVLYNTINFAKDSNVFKATR